MKKALAFILILAGCHKKEMGDVGVFVIDKSVDSITWHPPYLCSWTENYPTCYNLALKDTIIYASPLKVVKKEESGAQHDSIKIEGAGGTAVTLGGTLNVDGTMKLDIPGKSNGTVLVGDSAGNATWAKLPSASSNYLFTITCDPLRFPAPADSTVYYYGTMSGSMSTTVNNQRFPIGVNCTLVGVTFAARSSLASSGETSAIYLRRNNSSDLILHTGIQFTGGQAGNMYTVSGLNTNYNAGDYIELKLKCANRWTTNPANIGINTILYFKTR